VGLALQRGPEFRKKMQNAQKALQNSTCNSIRLSADGSGRPPIRQHQ
jgi:hypothetical protein